MTREQWKQMTPDQRRIKVAELCGWTRAAEYDYQEVWPPSNKGIFQYRKGSVLCRSDKLPDFENDLNAMHEAEPFLLDAFHRRRYYQHLDAITGDQWNTIVATAAQRAEAFVLTLEPGD